MFALLAATIVAASPAFTASDERLVAWAKAEAALKASSSDIKVILRAADARRLAGYYDEAIELLRGCKDPACALLLAMTIAATDDAPKMLAFYPLMLEGKQTQDELAASHRFHAQALLRSGKFAESVAAARKAIAVKDTFLTRLDLAIALFANGQVGDAEKELDAILPLKKTHGAALYWKYRCMRHRKNDREVVDAALAAKDALWDEIDGPLIDRGDLHFLYAEISNDLVHADDADEHRAIAAALHVTRHWLTPKKK